MASGSQQFDRGSKFSAVGLQCYNSHQFPINPSQFLNRSPGILTALPVIRTCQVNFSAILPLALFSVHRSLSALLFFALCGLMFVMILELLWTTTIAPSVKFSPAAKPSPCSAWAAWHSWLPVGACLRRSPLPLRQLQRQPGARPRPHQRQPGRQRRSSYRNNGSGSSHQPAGLHRPPRADRRTVFCG